MSGWSRFYRLGAEDADRRVVAALAPVPAGAVEQYLKTSRAVMTIDRATTRLREWWHASEAGRALMSAHDRYRQWPVRVRHQTVGSILLIAAGTHVALMLIQGPRPGFFWMVIPAMTVVFAAVVIAGSRSSKFTE